LILGQVAKKIQFNIAIILKIALLVWLGALVVNSEAHLAQSIMADITISEL
jgi:hypothetical protein